VVPSEDQSSNLVYIEIDSLNTSISCDFNYKNIAKDSGSAQIGINNMAPMFMMKYSLDKDDA